MKLIQIAKILRPPDQRSDAIVTSDTFATIDIVSSQIHTLRDGTIHQLMSLTKNNPRLEWDYFCKFSDSKPITGPTFNLVALELAPDYLSDKVLSIFSQYLSQCLRFESVVVAATQPANLLTIIYHQFNSNDLRIPIPSYFRSVNGTVDRMNGLDNYTVTRSHKSETLVFGIQPQSMMHPRG